MMIIWSVEVHEIREETASRYLAREFIKVIVTVLRKIAYASLLLPDLDRENRCRTVADAFICGVQDLSDDATSLCRCVCTIVYRAEYHLVTAT